MLMTISRGKAGRLLLPGSESSVSWRDVFRRNEDLLTGVLFGRLRFLSTEGANRVIALLVGQAHADNLGELERIEFWPKLKKLEGRAWVEPDVLMRFRGGFVLVEVKPPFGGSQSVTQWRAEVQALIAEGELGDGEAPGVLHFVALGNTGRPDGEQDIQLAVESNQLDITVHCREWTGILVETPRLAEESSGCDQAVFHDWMEAFSLFGLAIQASEDWTSLVSWRKGKTLSIDAAWLRGSDNLFIEVTNEADGTHWSDLAQYSQQQQLEIWQWK